ncbi:Putative acetyltransferase (fragment) [Syntrophaceticus schinkii]|uniref:Putative acetyltransferase n=1 Tax=Syntrophaceticus schinkii TaxID=499207 RepID=A0A0B7MD68_9FIRM
MDYYNYKGFFGKLKLYFKFLIDWILQTLAHISPHPGLTAAFHRMRGVRIGKCVYIGPRVHIDGDYPQLITIEDFVSIGMNTMIFAHSNPTCSVVIKEKFYPRKVAPTTIKKRSLGSPWLYHFSRGHNWRKQCGWCWKCCYQRC